MAEVGTRAKGKDSEDRRMVVVFFFFFCHHRLLWHKGEGRRGTWLVIKATQQSSRLQFLAFVACGYCLYEIRV